MVKYTTAKEHHAYLDSLIADFPQNNYIKDGKARKKQKRKELANKIAFQVMGGILVLAFTFFAISIEAIVELI